MFVTAEVSQFPMSWLKDEFVAKILLNMPDMFVTAAVFQLFMPGTVVNEEQSAKALLMFVVPVRSRVSNAVMTRLRAP